MIIQHGLTKAANAANIDRVSFSALKSEKTERENEHKLSAAASKFLAELRQKYSDFEFIAADKGDDLKTLVKEGDKQYTAVYSIEDIERMAVDPAFAAEKEQAIDTTVRMSKKINEQNGMVSLYAKNSDGFAQSEKSKQLMSDDKEMQKTMLEEMMANSNEEADAESKGFENLAKCLKIAGRIMNGDIVPIRDQKFLAENEPEMYEKAIMLRRVNPEPKKHKSLLEDENDKTEEMSGEMPEMSDMSDMAEDMSAGEMSGGDAGAAAEQ